MPQIRTLRRIATVPRKRISGGERVIWGDEGVLRGRPGQMQGGQESHMVGPWRGQRRLRAPLRDTSALPRGEVSRAGLVVPRAAHRVLLSAEACVQLLEPVAARVGVPRGIVVRMLRPLFVVGPETVRGGSALPFAPVCLRRQRIAPARPLWIVEDQALPPERDLAIELVFA